MPSFEQNKKNKLWSVRFRVIENGEEKNKRLSGFNTRKAANEGYVEFMKEYDRQANLIANKSHITFQELYDSYSAFLPTIMKESSAIAYTDRICRYALPYFKNLYIDEITSLDILNWKKILSEHKPEFSFKYKSELFGALVHILNFAVAFLDLPRNIASKSGGFKKSLSGIIETPLRFWEYEQFQAFDNAVKKEIKNYKDYTFRLMFLGYYFSGARKNELNAITFKDLDFQNSAIHFNKTVSWRNSGKSYKLTIPKSKNSIRITYMIKSYMDMLYEHLIHCQKQKDFKMTDYVFGGKDPIPENTIGNRFRQARSLTDLPAIRLHDLRHSHVSYLINHCGNDISMIYIIAERIGDRPEEVLKTYGHLFPSKQTEIIKTMNQQIKIN